MYVTSSGNHNALLYQYATATNMAIVAPILSASPIIQLMIVSAPLFALRRAANKALGTQQIAPPRNADSAASPGGL